MTLLVPSQASDQAKEAPKQPESEKTDDLEGIQAIIDHLQKGEWGPMVGAIMTVWQEYFGTPEEKAEIVRARKERKDAQTKKETRSDLRTLQTTVDETRESKNTLGQKEESTDEVIPYRPGTKKPRISPKETFRAQVEQIYAREDTLYSTDNLEKYFGRDYKRFIVEQDPVTHEQPISFLGRPISGGVNLIMLPFLKIAERKIMDLDLNYIPRQAEVRGFQDRNMCVGDEKGKKVLHATIPSFHKYGLAVDIDPDFNWPKDGRGTIPDEVIIAMAEAGFACGSISNPSFYYLMNDTMHYQLRFPPDSPAGQEIINASPIGRTYWKAIGPLLDSIKRVA